MTTANASEQPATSRGGLLARHPLISYFVMAYAFSWIAWSPWFLSEAGVGLLPYNGEGIAGLLNIAALVLGPTLSAFIMAGVTEGGAGIRRLLRRIVRWRVGLRWYLFVLVGIPLTMLLGTIVLPGVSSSFDAAALPSGLTYLGFFVVVFFLGGPLFEEIGWRGFALPRMQQLQGPLVGSLILGLLWAFWHLPLFLVPSWDTPHGSILDVVWFAVFCIAAIVVFTWVFNNTRGSVLVTILTHASINTFGTFLIGSLPAPIVTGSAISLVIGFGALALLLVAVTRGHLGYQNYRHEEPDTATAST